MATNVVELDLPVLEADTAERRVDLLGERLAAAERSWIARNEFGFSILHYPDVVAILRDRRWHSATSRIMELYGVTEPEHLARQRRSILSAEGDEQVLELGHDPTSPLRRASARAVRDFTVPRRRSRTAAVSSSESSRK